MTTPPGWDTVYAPGTAPPPCDIGRMPTPTAQAWLAAGRRA